MSPYNKNICIRCIRKQLPYSLTPRVLHSQPKIEYVAEWREYPSICLGPHRKGTFGIENGHYK